MIILMITTKKISIEYTLKEMRRESKCVTKKKNQNAKQAIMEEMRDKSIIQRTRIQNFVESFSSVN